MWKKVVVILLPFEIYSSVSRKSIPFILHLLFWFTETIWSTEWCSFLSLPLWYSSFPEALFCVTVMHYPVLLFPLKLYVTAELNTMLKSLDNKEHDFCSNNNMSVLNAYVLQLNAVIRNYYSWTYLKGMFIDFLFRS